MEKVLVVDDENAIRERLQKVLLKEGYQVLAAADGQEAIEIFERERPSIVLSDISMPRIDGMELMYSIRRIDSNAQIILMTGYGDLGIVVHAIRGGALDYLKKPIDLDQLFVALGRAEEKLASLREAVMPVMVLVVEDEQGTRDMIARVLQKEGYDVMTAEDGEQAVRCLEAKRPHLVVSDLRLPKKDGLELMATIRGFGWSDTEIVVTTGYGDEQSAIEALRHGAAAFLRKPIDLDELLIVLERAAERQKLRQSALFRKRELEIAKEVVASITSRREVLIRVGHEPAEALNLAETLLDALPFPLFAVDGEMHVMYANRPAGTSSGTEDRFLDEAKLRRFGLPITDYGAVVARVKEVFDATEPRHEVHHVGQWAFYFLAKVFLLTDNGTHKAVLVGLRGERPQR